MKIEMPRRSRDAEAWSERCLIDEMLGPQNGRLNAEPNTTLTSYVNLKSLDERSGYRSLSSLSI